MASGIQIFFCGIFCSLWKVKVRIQGYIKDFNIFHRKFLVSKEVKNFSIPKFEVFSKPNNISITSPKFFLYENVWPSEFNFFFLWNILWSLEGQQICKGEILGPLEIQKLSLRNSVVSGRPNYFLYKILWIQKGPKLYVEVYCVLRG